MANQRRSSNPYEAALALVFLLLLLNIYFWKEEKIGLGIVVLSLLLLLSRGLTKQVARIWDAVMHIMGRIMSSLLLSLIYIFLLCPLAWIYRLFNRSEEEQFKESSFMDRRHTFQGEDLENPW